MEFQLKSRDARRVHPKYIRRMQPTMRNFFRFRKFIRNYIAVNSSIFQTLKVSPLNNRGVRFSAPPEVKTV